MHIEWNACISMYNSSELWWMYQYPLLFLHIKLSFISWSPSFFPDCLHFVSLRVVFFVFIILMLCWSSSNCKFMFQQIWELFATISNIFLSLFSPSVTLMTPMLDCLILFLLSLRINPFSLLFRLDDFSKISDLSPSSLDPMFPYQTFC